MSHALPVIASDVGGNGEIVLNDKTGFLFPLNNKKEFVEKLKMLLYDQKLRTKFGNNGRDRVIEKFDIQNTVQKYQRLFNSCREQIVEKAREVRKELL